MTAIVGLVDVDGSVYIGGDSMASNKLGDVSSIANSKVFSPVFSPAFLMGACGSLRLAQVLRYHFEAPLPPGPDENFEAYIATVFSANLMECLGNAGMFEEFTDNGVEGAFLIAYQGKLIRMEPNFQSVLVKQNYMAIGTGDMPALGALHATQDKRPADRIALALEAAATYNAFVRGPFDVMRLPFDQDWTASKPKKTSKKRTKKRAAA